MFNEGPITDKGTMFVRFKPVCYEVKFVIICVICWHFAMIGGRDLTTRVSGVVWSVKIFKLLEKYTNFVSCLLFVASSVSKTSNTILLLSVYDGKNKTV